MNTITLGGAESPIAPLKTVQVASFLDATQNTKTNVQICSLSIRVLVQSLQNAKAPLVEGLDDNAAFEKINDQMSFFELQPAFVTVLNLSGVKVPEPGEAPAAMDSTSNEPIAAS
jgi:hypothetical protein